MEVKWFAFDSGVKRCTLEPVFSQVGRGASLDYDENASFHQILRNMELKGAAMEALADGGCGENGFLEIQYTCVGSSVCLEVEIKKSQKTDKGIFLDAFAVYHGR